MIVYGKCSINCCGKKIPLGKLRSFKKMLKTCVLIYNGLIIKQERISSPEGTEILSSVVLVKKKLTIFVLHEL